jgi:PKHD-type hydroxylase
MNLHYQYWFFKGALSKRFCDLVLQKGISSNKEKAYTGNLGDKVKNNQLITEEENLFLEKKRSSSIAWLEEQWIYREIHPYIEQANTNAGWNFEWDWTEQAQFTEYKPGQFYGWHQDCNSEPYGDDKAPKLKGKIRKLSFSILLNNPKEYEGGELEFNLRNNVEDDQVLVVNEAKKKGSIIIFPSFCWHQVKPVTRGIRYSLVTWHLGQPWK